MSSVEISFIIPAHNEQAVLHSTLKHLETTVGSATYEIVVVDDCSDARLAIDTQTTSPLILHRNERRLGVSASRNIGASLAQGSVLFFMDAHVCFSRHAIRDIVSEALREPFGIRGCTTQILREENTFRKVADRQLCDSPLPDLPYSDPQYPDVPYWGWQFVFESTGTLAVRINRTKRSSAAFDIPYVGACALALHKQLFEKLGGFDNGLTGFGCLEDAELCTRCWSFGHDVKVIPSAVCFHYSRPTTDPVTQSSPMLDGVDHPRYPGSVTNALRLLYLHFPERILRETINQINQRRAQRGAAPMEFAAPTEEMQRRKLWLESRRVHDEEWLTQRMTTVGWRFGR